MRLDTEPRHLARGQDAVSSRACESAWRQEHGFSGLTSGGPLGFPGEVSYGAAKAALENYTMSAAFELANSR